MASEQPSSEHTPPVGVVSALYLFPVKSCRGIAVPAGQVTARGFALDRRWMIVDAHGTFISQREVTELCLIDSALEQDAGEHASAPPSAIRLSAPRHGSVRLPVAYEAGEQRRVRVWKHEGLGNQHPEGSAWISQVLGRSAALVYMPESHERPVDPSWGSPGDHVSFADGFPFLVISQASLADLNARLDEPIGMRQFRPNIVVSGVRPYAEDDWARVRLGNLRFRGPKLCSRCVVTTIDPDAALRRKEPLRTLAMYRKWDNNVWFGMNLIPDGTGTLSVGDGVYEERGENHG
jgi:uncharacterized protein YcbX